MILYIEYSVLMLFALRPIIKTQRRNTYFRIINREYQRQVVYYTFLEALNFVAKKRWAWLNASFQLISSVSVVLGLVPVYE